MDPYRLDDHVPCIARMSLGDQHEQLDMFQGLFLIISLP